LRGAGRDEIKRAMMEVTKALNSGELNYELGDTE
jgi:hypothetical protein